MDGTTGADEQQTSAGTPLRSVPAPAPVDEVRVMGVLTVLWAVALVLTLVLPTRVADWGPWACVAGLAIGLLGLQVVLHRRRTPLTGPGHAAAPAPGRRRRD